MGFDRSHTQKRCKARSIVLGAALLVCTGGSYAVVSDAEFTSLQSQVEAIRELKFKHPVPYEVLSKDEIIHNLTADIDHDVSFPQYDSFLKAFSFVPPDFETRATMLRLYREQVGGYYDPKTAKFYLSRDSMAAAASGGTADLAAAVGLNMEDVTIAHELTHALQDQYFDLRQIEKSVDSGTEDQKLAVSSLFEGDATAVMVEQPMRKLGVDLSSMGDISGMLEQSAGPNASFPEFSKAPMFLQRSMTFPYTNGYHFITALRQSGGWAAVNARYRKLPASTQEILDPGGARAPVAVKLAPLSVQGWTATPPGTLGAYLTGVLLEQLAPDHPPANGIRHWAGDTYQIYQDGHQHWILLWDTQWTDAGSAAQFYRDLVKALPHKHPGLAYQTERSGADRMVWQQPAGQVTSVEHHDTHVLVVDGAPAAEYDAMHRTVTGQ